MSWTMADVKQKLPHLYTPNKWRFQIVKEPKATNIDLPSIDWNDYDLRCYTHDIPKPTATNSEIQVHGFKIKQQTSVDYSGQLTITFWQGVDFKIEQFFWGLFNASEDPEKGTTTNREDLKFDFKLISLDPSDELKEVREILVIGALVTDMDSGQLTGDQQADPAQLTVTIDYDYHLRNYKG